MGAEEEFFYENTYVTAPVGFLHRQPKLPKTQVGKPFLEVVR